MSKDTIRREVTTASRIIADPPLNVSLVVEIGDVFGGEVVVMHFFVASINSSLLQGLSLH